MRCFEVFCMTNGRGAGMASFMTKKKKYKFQVDICLEELLEVPFVSAVLFAKLRLLDGGSFQNHSNREEVKDHKVKWNAKFAFQCKMMANASTGVLERCILRISVRKECKGGRSFNKLGFVDLNLAEYAGAGVTDKKALLEGYDAKHRQDNSMLKYSIVMNMLFGDVLFKVPSPSLKHKTIVSTEDSTSESRTDEFSGGSLAGSIASGSSGFGSLPKKRPALLTSELIKGYTLPENNIPITVATDCNDVVAQIAPPEHDEIVPSSCETGHSRNSSNTSQLSKASGYSSIHSHSHSRQSSSGDSGHIRGLLPQRPLRNVNSLNPFHKNAITSKFTRVNTYPNNRQLKIPTSVSGVDEEIFSTPQGLLHEANFMPLAKKNSTLINNVLAGSISNDSNNFDDSQQQYFTPKASNNYSAQTSNISNSSTEDYKTPDESFSSDIFSQNLIELQKSASTSVVERIKTRPTIFDFSNNNNIIINRKSEELISNNKRNDDNMSRSSLDETDRSNLKKVMNNNNVGSSGTVLRSKSEFEIPRILNNNNSSTKSNNEKRFPSMSFFKSDSLYSFLTPRPKRKSLMIGIQSTPNRVSPPPATTNGLLLKIPASPIPKRQLHSLPETRTTSLNSLRSGATTTTATDCPQLNVQRNPSASSLVLSETGSLDRAKAAYERRKKTQGPDSESTVAAGALVSGRVENTRVNPDHFIAELLKDTNLEQTDDSAETSGLQLFIAKDGTAALGNHEVKSQMSTGAQVFKQVVMEDNR